MDASSVVVGSSVVAMVVPVVETVADSVVVGLVEVTVVVEAVVDVGVAARLQLTFTGQSQICFSKLNHKTGVPGA